MLNKRCVVGLLFLVLCSSVSYASGDYGCDGPRGTILFRVYDSCNSVPFLSPGNDSRLNLELLLIDAGKLKGTTTIPQYAPALSDSAWLHVPFFFEDWQVQEPGIAAVPDASNANSAANSNDYAEGEGSRCTSNGAGMDAFNKALGAAMGLPANEAAILKAARFALIPACNSTTHADWKTPDGVHSAVGREFAAYIAGVNAFYAGDFPTAENNFESLSKSANPWLRETSLYMVGRTLLNSAPQGAFGEWGALDLSKVNRDNLKGAEDAFNAYLHDFPQGVYGVSARGLLRRVYWLGNDQSQMADAFDNAFADAEKGANNVTVPELVQEADTKLLASVDSSRVRSPQLLAIIDLMRMRSDSSQISTSNTALTLADLEAQKDRFASNPELFKYLLAVFHLYLDNNPEQTLTLLPSLSDAPLSYFAFSQQTLRALAFEASKQFDEERKLLLRMLPLAKLPLQSDQLQLVLARLDEHTGHLDRVFAPASPIQDQAIRTILVEHSASAEMLRQRIKDPRENAGVVAAALYTLLYKELTGSKYQAFQADLALLPAHPSEFLAPFAATSQNEDAGYRCPSLREVASTLQRDGNDAQSLNCVGELVRNHGVHYGQDATPLATDLGGDRSLFPGKDFSRMDNYLKVIGNNKADGDARAYALFRAVRCYAPSGNNDCGKQEIPAGTRKQWFQMLHKDYAESVWAKSLKFYW